MGDYIGDYYRGFLPIPCRKAFKGHARAVRGGKCSCGIVATQGASAGT